jgi:hypothetical protein
MIVFIAYWPRYVDIEGSIGHIYVETVFSTLYIGTPLLHHIHFLACLHEIRSREKNETKQMGLTTQHYDR